MLALARGNDSPATLTDLQGIFSHVVSLAIAAAGVVFFVMFLVGGFQYLTASGNEQSAAGARKTLTFAIGGMVVIALSYMILVLIKYFTGVDVTKFSITQ